MSLTIGELSEATGVKTVTLRAWERRHGLLKPARTAGGHRLYRDDDVDRVSAIRAWLEQGVAVSQVAPLLGRRGGGTAQDLQPALQACLQGNGRHLEQMLNRELKERPLALVYRQWMLPMREQLLQIGPAGRVGLAFLDGFLAQKLSAMVLRNGRRVAQSPRVLVASPGWSAGHPAPLVSQALLQESQCPALLLFQALSAAAVRQSAACAGLAAMALVRTPASRAADLQRCYQVAARLDLPILLLDVAPGVAPRPGQGWSWCGDDPAELVETLTRELAA